MKRKEKLMLAVFVLTAALVSLTAISTIMAYRTSEPKPNITLPSFTYHYEYPQVVQSRTPEDVEISLNLTNEGNVPLNISVWLEAPENYTVQTCIQYGRTSVPLGMGENKSVQCAVRPKNMTAGLFQVIIHMDEETYGIYKSQPVNLATCYDNETCKPYIRKG